MRINNCSHVLTTEADDIFLKLNRYMKAMWQKFTGMINIWWECVIDLVSL